jgi:hypothetical protein
MQLLIAFRPKLPKPYAPEAVSPYSISYTVHSFNLTLLALVT